MSFRIDKDNHTCINSLLLRHANLVRRDKVVESTNILIEAGRIKSIGRRAEDIEAYDGISIDLTDLILFPGFIDLHLHGAIGIDTMEASSEDLHKIGSFLAEHGVCGWLPTLVPAPLDNYQRTVSAIKEAISKQDRQSPAARILGLHYEGPFINSKQCGALRSQYFQTFSKKEEIDSLPTIDDPSIAHMITLAPEIDGGIELIKELKRRGWIVSIGHTQANTDLLTDALNAGAKHMTHFFNAMAPLHHRKPGPIGWGLLEDGISCDVIADGVHSDPLMLRLLLRTKSSNKVILISDSVAPTGLVDGDYSLWGDTISVNKGRTSNREGSIAGSVITMHDAVKMMLSLGVPLEDIARMGAFNPAKLLGIDQEIGSIDIGKRADLVALDENGSIRLTIVGGQIVFNGM
jgi:N-acetylglucosamine-6-phosphate deacetylase